MFVEEKTQGEAEPVKVGTLKLSAAIREGAKLRKQVRGAPFEHGGSCAIGAAAEALGMQYSSFPAVWTIDAVAFIRQRLQQHIPHEVFERVYTMNDGEEQTREQVADWLESQGY